MTILPILTYEDPLLHSECEPFDFDRPQIDIHAFSQDLSDTMYEHGGVGLSAPQVGVLLRIFVMRIDRNSKATVCINPEIARQSGTISMEPEGCLSFPRDFRPNVKAPTKLAARFQGRDSTWREHEFRGIQARCYAHELDHLDGKTLLDRASTEAVEAAKARAA